MATTSEYKKPLPTPSHVSRPFWDAAKEHRLTYQRCTACGTRVFYPRDVCPGPECFGVGTLEWVESSGKGWVYASSISYQPAHPAFAGDVPYVLAIIELDEGVRMMGGIHGIENTPENLVLDMPLRVVFEEINPGQPFKIPYWVPA